MIQDPDRQGRIASWFWSVQEIPDILARWAPTCRRSGSTWSPCRRPAAARPALGALRRDVRAGRARPGPRHRAGQPVAGRPRDGADPADQPGRQPGARRRPTTARWCASCWPTRPCRSAPGRRGWPSRPTCTTGSPSWRGPGSTELRERGYDVVGDLDELLVGAAAARRTPTPTARASARSPAAAVDAIRALLLENARLRREQERLAGELDDARRRSSGTCGPTYRCASGVRRLSAARRPRRARGLPPWRGAGARGRRSARSARSRSRRRPCRPGRRPRAPAARR